MTTWTLDQLAFVARWKIWPLLRPFEDRLDELKGLVSVLLAQGSPVVSPASPGAGGSSTPSALLQQLAPLSVAPDDWDFGLAPAPTTDLRWGISAHVTVNPTVLSRGDIWSGANTVRYRVLNGRLLMQTGLGTTPEVASYALSGGSRADDAVSLVFTMDSSNVVTATDALTFIWSQSAGGDIDSNNLMSVSVSQAAVDTWLVVAAIKTAGTSTTLYTDTIAGFGCPIQAFGFEVHGGMFRAWAGPSLSSMYRLGADHASVITPDRVSIIQETGGSPNRTIGLVAFRRSTSMTF